MLNSVRGFSTNLLTIPSWFTQFKRTVFVLERMHKTKLNKLGADIPKKLRRKEFYYKLVHNTDWLKKPPIQLVLKKDVPGIGMKNEKIEMNPFIAYRDLLLPNLAVYARLAEVEGVTTLGEGKQYSSVYSKIVENYLVTQAVTVILSNDVPWTLQPWHIKCAFRNNGILTNENCITIPKEISGPNHEVENKDFLVYLTMNKSEVFPIRCRIYHWSSSDLSLNLKVFDINSPSEPLFPEQKEVIDSLIKACEEVKKLEKLKQYKTRE